MPLSLAVLSVPSPPSPVVFEVGPFTLRYYGLFIVLGIVVGAWLTGRELARRGYQSILALESLFLVVPLGLLGARLYHFATEYDSYANPFPTVLKVWGGGVGIYGAIAGGFLGVLIFSWYRGISPLVFADAAAPGVILGQAIGRWGDYFNQELFGEPSRLPWAISVALEKRPAEFADSEAFHPTFLYESIWDLLVCLALLWVVRRFARRLKGGDVFLLYLILFSVGYLIIGTLRIVPPSFFIAGVVAIGSALILLLRHLLSPRGRSQGRK